MRSYLKLGFEAFALFVVSGLPTLATAYSGRCPKAHKQLEVYVLLDGTRSFSSFVEGAREQLPSLLTQLQATYDYDTTKAGIGLFGGLPDAKNPGNDTCFKQLTTLTADRDTFFEAASEEMTSIFDDTGKTVSDYENSLEPLVWLAGSGAGFTPYTDNDEIVRIMLIITDANPMWYEVGGRDTPETYPNPDLLTDIKCGPAEPTGQQVAEALLSTNVHPIVLMTDYPTVWTNLFRYEVEFSYSDFQALRIKENPADILPVAVNAIDDLLCSLQNPAIDDSVKTTTTTTTSYPLFAQTPALPHRDCSIQPKGLEVYVLMDGTKSFAGYLQEVRSEIASLTHELSAFYKYSSIKLGLGLFGGLPNDQNPGPDTCFRHIRSFSDTSNDLTTAVNQLSTFYTDVSSIGAENSLEPLVWLAGSGANFTQGDDDIIRIVLIITDAFGRWPGALEGEEVPDSYPNPDLMNDLKCGPLPPVPEQVREALRATKVYPLIMSTDSGNARIWDNFFSFTDLANMNPEEYYILQVEKDPMDLAWTAARAIRDFACSIHYSSTTDGPN